MVAIAVLTISAYASFHLLGFLWWLFFAPGPTDPKGLRSGALMFVGGILLITMMMTAFGMAVLYAGQMARWAWRGVRGLRRRVVGAGRSVSRDVCLRLPGHGPLGNRGDGC